MARLPAHLAPPYGEKVLTLPAELRERLRRAVLTSPGRSDVEVCEDVVSRLRDPRVDAFMVRQMLERLRGLGVIRSGGRAAGRKSKAPDPRQLDLIAEQ